MSLTEPGTCTLTPQVIGNDLFAAATGAPHSITVSGAGPPPGSGGPVLISQVIAFTSEAPITPSIGQTYQPTATGGLSGNPVTFAVSGACAISGGTVTFTAHHACLVHADQAGAEFFAAAAQQAQAIDVGKTQTITFTSTPPSPAWPGARYTVTATAPGGPVRFSTPPAIGTNSPACLLNERTGTITFARRGTCTIWAVQPGNDEYRPAPRAEQVIDVAPMRPGRPR